MSVNLMIRSTNWSTSHMTFLSGILSVFNILEISKTPYLDSWITVPIVIAVNTETVTKRLLTRPRRKKNTPHTIHRESKGTANCKYKRGLAVPMKRLSIYTYLYLKSRNRKTNWRRERERDTTLISLSIIIYKPQKANRAPFLDVILHHSFFHIL